MAVVVRQFFAQLHFPCEVGKKKTPEDVPTLCRTFVPVIPNVSREGTYTKLYRKHGLTYAVPPAVKEQGRTTTDFRNLNFVNLINFVILSLPRLARLPELKSLK